MGPKRSAAKRGTLGKQQWEDLRQAARLSRTEGVTLTFHGVQIDPPKAARSQGSAKGLEPAHRAGKKGQASKADEELQPMDTTDGGSKSSKNQQRSAQRLEDFQKAKRAEQCVEHWQLMVRLVCRQIRAKLLADTWTGWMRSKCARTKLCRTLWPIVWREWTRPSEEVMAALEPAHRLANVKTNLKTCSARDAYILRKARRVLLPHNPPRGLGCRSVRIGWLRQRPAQDDASSEEEDDDNSGPSAVGVQPKASRKSSAAGLQTPGSGRSNRKKTRARQSP